MQQFEFHEETGEVLEDEKTVEETSDRPQPQKLSERAAAGVEPPPYWRRVDAIQGDGGPLYELAFFNAQAEIPAMIEADKNNPHFKSRYASLAGILERIRPILTKNRLTIKQHVGRIHRLGSDSNKMLFLPVLTTLTHVDSGQGETFPWEMPIEKATPIAISSLSTTAKRYSICSIFGIATVDDDSAATMIRNKIENEQSADILEMLLDQIKSTKTMKDLKAWLKSSSETIENLPEEKTESLRKAYAKRKGELEDAEASQDPADNASPQPKEKKAK